MKNSSRFADVKNGSTEVGVTDNRKTESMRALRFRVVRSGLSRALTQQTGDSVCGDVEREILVDFALDSSEF